MRYIVLQLFVIMCLGSLSGQSPMITEIHYDNNYDQNDPFGIDSIEYVEIYINDPQPALSDFVIVLYDPDSGDPSIANFKTSRDLTTTLRTESTPNGMYYVVEFQDTTFFGFPAAGINDGTSGVALVEIGTPNIVHQFWRYETCDPFTAADGPAAGAESDPISTDFSRTCGSSGVFLVQMNSALNTNRSIQQNGFGDWYLSLNTSRMFPLENAQNVPVELLSFEGSRKGKHVELNWSTASEVNNDYFEIVHSTNGVEFSPVAQVNGVGESVEIQNYTHLHREVSELYNYYRLIQHDFNGDKEIVGEIVVKGEANADIHVYPSSVNYELQIEGLEEPTTATIYDVSGNVIFKSDNIFNSLNVNNLNAGVYFLQINSHVLKFTKI